MQPPNRMILPAPSTQSLGLNRLASPNLNDETFFTMIIRLCTRSSLSTKPGILSQPPDPRNGPPIIRRQTQYNMQESIRDALHAYILQEFRTRIPLAISWLTEEWYADRLLLQSSPDAPPELLNYNRLTLRLTDGMLPFLDAKDKIFIRYLSELPWLTREILGRVKMVAEDPERVALSMASLRYLLMFRPPARTWICDVLEDVWTSNEGARNPAGKLLKVWRPEGVVARG